MDKKNTKVYPSVGLKFRFSNENEEVVICEITKIENNIVYYEDENGNEYTGYFKDFFN